MTSWNKGIYYVESRQQVLNGYNTLQMFLHKDEVQEDGFE